MHLESYGDPTGQLIGLAVDQWLQKRPALETVIKPFAAVFTEKARISRGLTEMVGPLDAVRAVQGLGAGIPMA